MEYGITPTGYRKKTDEEILSSIFSRLKEKTGIEPDRSPDGPIGQIFGVVSSLMSEIEDENEHAYQQLRNPRGDAFGIKAGYVGLTRLQPSHSIVKTLLIGDNGTTVASYSMAKKVSTGETFYLQSDVTIRSSACMIVSFEVVAVGNGLQISVSINGVVVSYTATGTDTEETAMVNFKEKLMDHPLMKFVEDINEKKIRMAFSEAVTITNPLNIAVTDYGSEGLFVAFSSGKIACAIDELNSIVTPVSGWKSVRNIVAGQRGRGLETDEDFSIRREKHLRVSGGSSAPAIEAKILSFIPNVSWVRCFQNDSDYIDRWGRPPHTVHIVAEGGDDNLLCRAIYAYKAGGVATYGSQYENILDNNGNVKTVFFDRPTPNYLWVEITITQKNWEKAFPSDGKEQIQSKVSEFVNRSDIGEDVIIQSLFTPINEVDGIKRCTVRVATTATPHDSPIFTANDIPIAPDAYSEASETRIIVIDNA